MGNQRKKKRPAHHTVPVSSMHRAKKTTRKTRAQSTNAFSVHDDVVYFRKHVHKLWEYLHEMRDRVQDLEILSDLLERLIVTLSLHKFGMRLSELRRMIRRIEKEALAESEVRHLEELFKKPSRKPLRKRNNG